MTVELFLCTKTGMRLTAAGCGRLYLSTHEKRPKEWEGRFACLGCPVGRINAGGEPAGPAELAAEVWHDVCARCLTSGSRIINSRLCVSCYNRDREAAIGRDRKGNRPVLADAIHPVMIVMQCGDQVERLQADRVLAASEMMIAAAKAHKTSLIFGWSVPHAG